MTAYEPVGVAALEPMMHGTGDCVRCNQLSDNLNALQADYRLYEIGSIAALAAKGREISRLQGELDAANETVNRTVAENQRLRAENERLHMPVCKDTTYQNQE